MDYKQHMENVIDTQIRPIFEKAAARIESLKPKEKVIATGLAKEIAKEFGMTGPQLYPTLKLFINHYPGVVIKKGAHGGIEKLDVAAATPADDNTDSTVVESTEE